MHGVHVCNLEFVYRIFCGCGASFQDSSRLGGKTNQTFCYFCVCFHLLLKFLRSLWTRCSGGDGCGLKEKCCFSTQFSIRVPSGEYLSPSPFRPPSSSPFCSSFPPILLGPFSSRFFLCCSLTRSPSSFSLSFYSFKYRY